VPVEWRHHAHQNAHAQPASQIPEATLILSLRRSGGPFLLPYYVPKIVQLSSRDLIVKPNDLPVRALKTGHAPIRRVRRKWVEARIPDVESNRLKILATRVADTQTQLDNEPIDLSMIRL
jgi:hypothetical protein